MALTRRTFLQLLGLSASVVPAAAVASTQQTKTAKDRVDLAFDHASQRFVGTADINGTRTIIGIAAEQIVNGGMVARTADWEVVNAKDHPSHQIIGIARNSAPAGGEVEVVIGGMFSTKPR